MRFDRAKVSIGGIQFTLEHDGFPESLRYSCGISNGEELKLAGLIGREGAQERVLAITPVLTRKFFEESPFAKQRDELLPSIIEKIKHYVKNSPENENLFEREESIQELVFKSIIPEIKSKIEESGQTPNEDLLMAANILENAVEFYTRRTRNESDLDQEDSNRILEDMKSRIIDALLICTPRKHVQAVFTQAAQETEKELSLAPIESNQILRFTSDQLKRMMEDVNIPDAQIGQFLAVARAKPLTI